ncbi:hypothetical protein M413DRAFT_273643 [Hebeloma cylindrosporum]|uniref:Protein kinase domain-containing protein n=1 Tax=Hebeloma cylindrosporum TaxID=76867 RepID=A0A0C3C130_HEBCY|nr:hypothetical protein M413DRAFT_273643 [Hebeloma cylindrosporum h7]
MDFLNFINDKHHLHAKLGEAAAKVSKAFQERGNGDSPMPQLDAVAKGYDSLAFMLQTLSSLELRKVFQGQPLSSALITRLLSLEIGDFAQGNLGRKPDVLGSLVKLCLEEEADLLKMHAEGIAEAGKGIHSLGLSLASVLFDNLLMRTAKEEPEIREFFQGSGLEDLTDYIILGDARHVATGGYADVFETGLLRPQSEQPRKVAVKVLRINQGHLDAEDGKKLSLIRRRLRREIQIWQSLHHINVVPLLGLTHQFNGSPLPSMVCAWMAGGTLSSHLKERRATLTLRSRYKLLQDVIDGLQYLHSQNVVHGDLTSGNVLMSQNMACLCDFGLSKVIGELPVYPSTNMVGTPRWAAPELYCYSDAVPQSQLTKECDIYSYGCIIHEVISTYIPYYNVQSEHLITLKKARQIAPDRPPSAPLLTDDVWDFIQLCWRDYPPWRPDADEVRERLKELVREYSKEELLVTLPAVESGARTDLEAER